MCKALYFVSLLIYLLQGILNAASNIGFLTTLCSRYRHCSCKNSCGGEHSVWKRIVHFERNEAISQLWNSGQFAHLLCASIFLRCTIEMRSTSYLRGSMERVNEPVCVLRVMLGTQWGLIRCSMVFLFFVFFLQMRAFGA